MSRPHPRRLGWIGTSAIAMGGSNQMVFLIGALIAGQGEVPGQGTAAIVLLAVGLLLSWFALPGWTELILMWPNRVGGIAATCGEAFRPYAPVLGNLTGMSYWWGWIPTCGLTALLSASAIESWFLPGVSVPGLACVIILVFVGINFLGVQWAARVGTVIAAVSALLAFLSVIIPVAAGSVDWHQASSFELVSPFPGKFGALTSVMAGLYLVGFAAPAFEAAACHVGETIDPRKNIPRAMYASAGMATLYFLVIPAIWLGVIGKDGLTGDLAITLGPVYAPLFGALGKSLAIWFMMFNMFHGTLAPLTGVARTLSQLSEDGLLPELFAKRTSTDCPWVAILITAGCAIVFLLIGDPVWLVAAANLTYLIGIALPSVAVWLLRRDKPDMPRLYRAPRGTVTLGLFAAVVWGIATVLGFQQFGLPTVILGLVLAYSGAALYGWRRWRDRRKAGLPSAFYSLHVKLTGAMLLVLLLDGAGYYMAVHSVTIVQGHQTVLVAALEDIFVVVALLTITVGLVLPGMVAHSTIEVAQAADRLATGTMADFSRAMTALASGELADAQARVELVPVVVTTRDEVGQMARSFNTLQEEIARAAIGLAGAREGLRTARDELTNNNANLEQRVTARTAELEVVHQQLVTAARKAGMAEVAIGVLHNIGNVLNSVNVSAGLLGQKLQSSNDNARDLRRLHSLLCDHATEIGRFMRDDPKGKLVTEYVGGLVQQLEEDRHSTESEVDTLTRSIDHIKRIVSGQQALILNASLVERVDPRVIMEDAIHISTASLGLPNVQIDRDYAPVGELVTDKHQLLQILINLVSNAIRAVSECRTPHKRITVAISSVADRIMWKVQDNGVGIPKDRMPHLFEYGFTTKTSGEGGVGLHSAAIAATRMHGRLHAHSDGDDTGAAFCLELPVSAPAPANREHTVAS